MKTKVIMAPNVKIETPTTKKSSKSTRPVRMSRFEVHEYDIDDEPNLHTIPSDAPIFKSDVHYCTEKFAIDYIAHNGENNVPFTKLALYKKPKTDDLDAILVSIIYWDENTKQVVID